MSKISIIIPCYNVEKFLQRCLDSVINQTFSDFEAICVNDGSLDNSKEILENYAKKDSRFKIINQKNQGLSIARNNGLKKANGEWIYFLDSDDFMHPKLLEYTYDLAIKYDAQLVSFRYSQEKDFKNLPFIEEKFEITNNPLFYVNEKFKYKICFNVWTKLYKKELLEGILFIPNIYYEDYPHTFAICAKRPKTVISLTELYYYETNQDSITFKKSNPKQIKDYFVGIKSVCEIYKDPKFKKELKFLKAKFFPIILRHQLEKCLDASDDIKPLMFEEFRKVLIYLDDLNLISFIHNKLKRYLFYKKLIKKGFDA